jgi:hypothetical protein
LLLHRVDPGVERLLLDLGSSVTTRFGRAVLEELELVLGRGLVGEDLADDRRQPRHAAVAGERVGDRREVRDLLREQRDHLLLPELGRRGGSRSR